jgi:prepilin-type processing-associated H-X9-DG protein
VGGYFGWDWLLRPYLGLKPVDHPDAREARIFICPGDPTQGGQIALGAGAYGLSDAVPVQNWARDYRSYNINANVTANGVKRNEIKHPSETILFADFPFWSVGTNVIQIPDHPAARKLWEGRLPTQWHNGSINCAFVDGHVESFQAATLHDGASNGQLWWLNWPTQSYKLHP